MAERASRGVRRVNENLLQEGRALILTEEQADKLLWSDIPVGSIRINTSKGDDGGAWSVKLEGESGWVPGGIKNDGTINIAKDSHIAIETFIVKEVEDLNNPGTFAYYYEDAQNEEHVRHGIVLYKNSVGQYGRYRQYGKYSTWKECRKAYGVFDDALESKYQNMERVGFVFSLELGDYAMERNQLEVMIDDALIRTARNGGIIELSETRFCLLESIESGMKIGAQYVHAFRLGNPYPRWFFNEDEPEVAEVGDFFIDTDEEIDDDFNNSLELFDDDLYIDWDRIRPSSRPTSLAAYGIKDKISLEGHMHTIKDIKDFPTAMPANGGRADTANRADNANLAANATNAVNAASAELANRAIADDKGRNISETYATIESVNSAVESSLIVQEKMPEGKDNRIWFDTHTMLIKVFINGKWEKFGAVYKEKGAVADEQETP